MILRWPRHGLWLHHDFRRLWAAQAVSATGSRITRTVLPLIAISSLHGTPNQVALLTSLQVAPGIAVGLLLGGHVDRGSKRAFLVGTDLLRAALLVSIPIVAWLGSLTWPHLYVVAALTGAATALFDMADKAWLPSLIGRANLVEGNSKLNTTESLAETVGPGLGGILMQALTAPVAILFDAASYLWSALFIGRIQARETREQVPDDAARPGLMQDAIVGARASWTTALVRPLFLMRGTGAFFGGFFLALYSLFGIEVIGLSPGALGIIISAGGAGALVGALVTSRLHTRGRYGRVLIVSATLTELTALALPAAAWAPSHALAVALMLAHQLVSDGFRMVAWTLEASLRQAALPDEVLGRATGTLNALLAALLPLGALVAGLVAEATSVRTALLVGILGGLLGPMLLALSKPLRRLEALPSQ